MKTVYSQIFNDYGIREKGKSFSPTMSEYLWFKLYDFSQQNYANKALTLTQVLALLQDSDYYVASLVKKLQGKTIIQHGEIYAVKRADLHHFLMQMNADFTDSWGMINPVVAFNQPIQCMIYFRGNTYWLEKFALEKIIKNDY